MKPIVQDFVVLLGRVLLSLVFLVAGADKVLHFSANLAYMGTRHIPFAVILLIIAMLVELAGALMILLGWQARWAALLLLLYVVVVTLVFHSFWTYPPVEAANQAHLFFKNFAIMGGMLYIFAYGSARFSLDRLLKF